MKELIIGSSIFLSVAMIFGGSFAILSGNVYEPVAIKTISMGSLLLLLGVLIAFGQISKESREVKINEN